MIFYCMLFEGRDFASGYISSLSLLQRLTFVGRIFSHALAIAYLSTFLLQIASDKRIIAFCGSIRPCAVVLWAKYTHEVSIWFKSDLDGTSKGFNLTCTAIEESKKLTYTLFGRQ